MREIRPSGSKSGRWKRSMARLVRHRQTKGPETAGPDLNHRATSRLYLHPGLATMLLDAGASLTIRDSLLQSTPLGWACRWGHIELVRLYLERGADALEADAERWATPLAWATKGGYHEIIELLRSHGAR